MADSPFAPDESIGVAPEIPMQSEVEPTHDHLGGGKSAGSKHLDAALAALAGLAMFAPVGKITGLASTPLRRMALGGGMGAGMAALSDAAGAQQKEGAPSAPNPGAGFPSPMHELQFRLGKAGLYDGPVDGVSKPGGKTEIAVGRLKSMFGEGDPLHLLRMQQDPNYRASEEAKTHEKNQADITNAQTSAARAETERKKGVDKAIAEAMKDQETWGAMAARWAPWMIGGAAGATLGGLNSWRLARKAGQTAEEADKFATKHFTGEPVGNANFASNAAAVNTYWGKGKGTPPFSNTVTSGELSPNAQGYTLQDHTPVEKLYDRTRGDKIKIGLTDAAAVGAAGLDYFGSDKMSDYYQRQADTARDRYAKTKDLQDAVEKTRAQSMASGFQLAKSGALPFISMYGLMRKAVPMGSAKPSMDSQKAADETRMNAQDFLNRQPIGGPRSPIGPGGQPRALNGGGVGTPNQTGLNGEVLPPPPGGGGGGQQQLPPPAGIGGHTSDIARQTQNELRQNFLKILQPPMGQRTQELVLEHTRDIPVSPDGTRSMTVRQVNKLKAAIEQEHGMTISAWSLKRALRQAGFKVP